MSSNIPSNIDVDPEWDATIVQLTGWLRSTKQIAFTPRWGKALIVKHKPPPRRKRLRS